MIIIHDVTHDLVYSPSTLFRGGGIIKHQSVQYMKELFSMKILKSMLDAYTSMLHGNK
jgi:hypothetical protein